MTPQKSFAIVTSVEAVLVLYTTDRLAMNFTNSWQLYSIIGSGLLRQDNVSCHTAIIVQEGFEAHGKES